VSITSVIRAWNDFFFAPQRPTPVALYRIFFGLLIIADLILLYPDWLTWFSENGVMRMATMHKLEPGSRINVFTILPSGDAWIYLVFWVMLLCAICLTIGLFTRASSIAVFVGLVSLDQRNIYMLHGGDALLRTTAFFLMFAPSGAALSVDRLLRIYRGKETHEVEARAPWAQRLIQIQIALAYFATFYWKTLGPAWINGTALYYVMRLDEFRRFPAPLIENMAMIKAMTWFTLVVEFSLGVLVWIRELRYPVLLVGAILHLSIEYTMNIPLFQWTMIASYANFIYPEDLTRAWDWIRSRFAVRLGELVPVVYDGACARCAREAEVLRAVDVFRRLRILDIRSAEARTAFPELTPQDVRTRLLVWSEGQWLTGFDALRRMSSVVPLFWPFAPFSMRRSQLKQSLNAATAAK
jgi:hypothetical protein